MWSLSYVIRIFFTIMGKIAKPFHSEVDSVQYVHVRLFGTVFFTGFKLTNTSNMVMDYSVSREGKRLTLYFGGIMVCWGRSRLKMSIVEAVTTIIKAKWFINIQDGGDVRYFIIEEGFNITTRVMRKVWPAVRETLFVKQKVLLQERHTVLVNKKEPQGLNKTPCVLVCDKRVTEIRLLNILSFRLPSRNIRWWAVVDCADANNLHINQTNKCIDLDPVDSDSTGLSHAVCSLSQHLNAI